MQDNDSISVNPAPTVQMGNGPQPGKARGSFSLSSSSSKPKPIKIYAAIALMVIVFLAAFIGIWTWAISEMKLDSGAVDESKAVADATLATQAPKDNGMKEHLELKRQELEEQRLRAEAEKKKLEEAAPPPPPPPNKNHGASNRTSAENASMASSEMTAVQRKLGGGVMMAAGISNPASYAMGVSGEQGESNAQGRPLTAPAGYPGGNADASMLGGTNSSSRGNLNDLSGATFAPTQATLAPAGKYLLAHGTFARCVVYQEVVTEQPGITDCRLTDPLYSADGSTVISEASSRLTGVQSVAMAPGQQNVFTSWTELETTAGVRARLDSLGAGPMGASGTKAWINNHYLERYGGAVMLSLVQDVFKAVTTRKQGSDSGGYTVNNSEQNIESMADKALNSTIGIAPTGHILPGTVITVIVARDIDFSSVYENH